MKTLDAIRLSFKNLARQKSRTTLTITAITIGSLSVILMSSILLSVRQSLMDSFKKMGAFNLVTVVQDPNSTDNTSLISAGNGNSDSSLKKIDDTTLSDVLKIPHVVGATPTLNVWVKTMRLDGNDKKSWANLLAYTPSSNVFDMPLLAGRNITDTDMDKIVVGANFLNTYGDPKKPSDLIGKKVILVMNGGSYPDWGTLPPEPPQNADKSWWDAQQSKDINLTAEIVGVADNGSMDDKQNYISLAWGERLNTSVQWQYDDSTMKTCQDQQNQANQAQKSGDGKSGGVNLHCENLATMKLVKDTSNITKNGYGSIIIKADDQNNAKSVGDAVAKMGFGAVTAENMIKQINQIFTMVSVILGIIGGISLFVAAIGIINTMVMATYERIREIGVMRACGATRADIRHLFMIEAATLGFWGGVFGLIISIILVSAAKWIILNKGASLGNIPIDKIGSFPIWLVVSVIAFTTLVGLLSGLGPAIKAARLNPVDALRYE